MASSVIGQLRVILGLDTAAFEKGLSDAERELSRSTRKMERFGQRIENIGKRISVGVTLPILAVGGAALGMAAKFESAMNRVEAATGATGKQLDALKQKAVELGKDKGFTATAAETADVMEALAKNGLAVEQILGGATEATLRLAAANGAEFEPAADAVTDIIQQFGRNVSEANGIVDKMTGAMLASKMGFDDYRLAIGQAGGVAGGIGVEFEDMNVALAATSALFASGSDAGTSFKTFLTSLPGKAKEAKETIKKYGLSFYDAQGSMKSLEAIAQSLQDKLGHLDDQTKSEVLTKIFGTDAMRTAIGLMNQGAEGLARFRAEIDKASAQTQMEARMKGWSGTITQVKKSFEAAAIALGDSGILAALTKVLTLVAATIGAFADLPQPIQLVIGVMLGLTAVVGPLLVIGGKAITMWGGLAALLLGRVVPAATATAIATTATGTAASGAVIKFVALRGAMAFLTGPWGIAIAAITAGIGALALASDTAAKRVDRVSKAAGDSSGSFAALYAEARKARIAQEELAESQRKGAGDTKKLTTETDRLTAALTRLGVAKQWDALQGARANLADARQRYAAAKSNADKQNASAARANMGHGGEAARGQAYAARAELKAASELLVDVTAATEAAAKNMQDALRPPQAASAPPASSTPAAANDDDEKSGGKGKGRSGPTKEELAARREELRLEAEIAAAELRGDEATAQRLRDQMDLRRQIDAYIDAGLSDTEAQSAAVADHNAILAARRIALARELDDQRQSVELDMARLADDEERVQFLEREEEIKERILFFERQLVEVANEKLRKEQATVLAMEQQERVDAARAAGRAKWLAEDEARRQIDLMKARGDSEEAIRQAERRYDIERRIAELKSRYSMGDAEARATAEAEDREMEIARQKGEWRGTIKDAFRAAMDGDLKGFAKNFWKDMFARSMEDALNSISDFLFGLFRNAFSQGAGALGGSGGGGILGALGGLLGIGGGNPLAGSLSTASKNVAGLAAGIEARNLKGFAKGTSGWLKPVGGMAGVDKNLVSFRMSSNEEFAVRRKGEVGGPVGSGASYHFTGNLLTPEWWAEIEARDMASSNQAVGKTERRARRRQARRMGR
ncbi:MAG: phage tail tape measure protein [Sphingobium sp.]